jgi:hypothetical protein
MALRATLCAASVALAQGPGNDSGNGPGGPGGPGGGPPPPPLLPPVIQALDTNHDGVIDASEIQNAPQSLRTLEKSGSDQLTIPELLGPPPWLRHHGQGQGGQGGDQQGGPPQGPPPGGGDQGGGPPPDLSGTMGGTNGDNPDASPSPSPSGQNGHHHHRLPPVIQALDTNHDGIIDSSEIDNAAQSLKTLEKDGHNYLTIPDLLGPPPRGMRPPHDGGPNGPPSGDNGSGGPPPDLSGTMGGTNGDSGPPPPPPPPQ